MLATGPDPAVMGKRALDLAVVASILAEEASALALLHSGHGHDSDVAVRAAVQAREAADVLKKLREDGAPAEQTIQAATWALSAAAVALTQAKLNTRLGPSTKAA
jgi:hypothetical protein